MSLGIGRLHQDVDFDDLVRRFERAPEEIDRTQLVRLRERAMAARPSGSTLLGGTARRVFTRSEAGR